MIERIIHFSIHNKLIIGIGVILIAGLGIFSLSRLTVDAVPDATNNQVQIISIAPSLAVQEVELFVTAPIEVSLASIPKVIELRSISRLGLSVVTVVFKDGADIYWARQQISERLAEAEEQIPKGLATISMAPVSSGLGEIYQYTLDVDKGYDYSLGDLRTIQDWIVRRQMLGTPGVADVNSYGGFVKQYEIAVNPDQLRSMGLTLTDIFEALERNNENTGSAYIDKKPTSYFIRGIGLASSLEDVGKIVVKRSAGGTPVLIRDIANVQFGHAPRYGAFVKDTSEVVGGVVMMLKGANAKQVIRTVEERMLSIQASLPEGIKIVPYLDRSDLVDRAIGTVSKNLLEGGLIVIFILVLFLGNLRAGLIVASVIPLSMLFAVSLMNLLGVSGNLMSLGAIDFGLIVDGAVIIVESAVHRMALHNRKTSIDDRITQEDMDQTVFQSARKMMTSATFGQIIILVVYLPILTLVGVEGKMFRPMAEVVSFALIGAILLSITWVPMATALFLNRKIKIKETISDKVIKRLSLWISSVFIKYVFRHKILLVSSAVALFAFSIFVFTRLGGEFIPTLEEGDLAAGIMTLQGGSLSNTVETVEKANRILLTNFPEIKSTICKIGAGEIPTDPTPMETGDYIITLKDKSEWTSAGSREELVSKMEEKLAALPGVKFEFQQPIQMRFNELMTGSRQDVAIKIFGDNLDSLSVCASMIEARIKGIQGIEDINVEKVTGLSQIQVEYNRDRMAQYGLSVADVNRVLRAAFAGMTAGVIYEEEKRFDIVVRLSEEYRQDIDNVRNLPVSLPDGQQLSLDQVADVQIKSGPAQVSREDAHRRITVGFNVRGRDIETVVKEVKSDLSGKLRLPPGYYIQYGGEFQTLAEARNRLAVAVPIALILIFLLLYFTFHSLKQTLLIFTAVPLASIGGIFALYLRDMNFSISAGIGFIALFGVAVLNGIVLIAEFNRLKNEGMTDIHRRVIKGLEIRLRPILMTAAVASLGFLPMALSTSAGAEVQKPLATVVIGGLITSTLLTLVILPILYILFTGRRNEKNGKQLPKNVVLGLTLLLLFVPFSMINAQKPESLTAGQAISIALEQNLELKKASLNVNLYERQLSGAWNLDKTEFSAEIGQMNSKQTDNSFAVSQRMEFPAVYALQKKLARGRTAESKLNLEYQQNEIIAEVKSAYWDLVYLNSRFRLLQYEDSLFAGLARAAKRRAETGESNQLEMISASSQSMEVKDELNQAAIDRSIAMRKLQYLLNKSNPITPADTTVIPLVLQLQADSARLQANPLVALARNQSQSAVAEVRLSRMQMMPDVTLGAFSQTMKGTQEVNGIPTYFGPGDRLTGFQAGISIPLWYKPWKSAIETAKVQQQIAECNEQEVRNQLEYQLFSMLEEFRKLEGSLKYYNDIALPEATQILRQSEAGFKAGAIDYSNHIPNLQRVLQIRAKHLECTRQYNQCVILIEQLLNTK